MRRSNRVERVVPDTVNEAAPLGVEAKFASTKGALDTLRATEEEMKAYIAELEKARPEGAGWYPTLSQS